MDQEAVTGPSKENVPRVFRHMRFPRLITQNKLRFMFFMPCYCRSLFALE